MAKRSDNKMLRVSSINKSFGDNQVLKGIDFTVYEGEVVVVIGPSGSGKSTLLRCINFLEKGESGQIYFQEELVENKEVAINKMRQSVGMVFQHFYLFPHMTVLENII